MSDTKYMRDEIASHLSNDDPKLDELTELGVRLVGEIEGGPMSLDEAILALDEAVHEAMESGPGSAEENSERASSINNQGLDDQVACILAANGATDGERTIREAVNLQLPAAPRLR